MSLLLAFHAKSIPFTNHHYWYSSTTESLKFTNPASLESHQSSTPRIYDHAFQGLSTLHSRSPYELEVSKKPPRFSFASNEKTFTLYNTPKFLSANPSLGIWHSDCNEKHVIVIVINHAGVWPESGSFKDNGVTAKVPNKWKGLATKIRNLKISMKGSHDESRARLAIYKVSWDEGRRLSYVLVAMDQGNIVDGVDVILLFFTSCTYAVPSEINLLAEASFAAMEKGMRVSAAAGYKGIINGFHGLTII